MFEKWLAGMKEDWVLHLHTNQKVVALLLDLMATPSEIATMADLDDLTIATTDHAARSFQVTTVYPVIDRQMEVLLATRPFEMLKIASEQDLPDLARRSIKHMTSDSIWEYCGTSEKRDEFLAGLRPDWQVQFYKTLLLASTRSCRKLESEIRSIVKLDSNVFRLAAEEEGENVKPDPTSGSPWTSKRADGR